MPNQALVHEHETDWALVTLTLLDDPLQVIVGRGLGDGVTPGGRLGVKVGSGVGESVGNGVSVADGLGPTATLLSVDDAVDESLGMGVPSAVGVGEAFAVPPVALTSRMPASRDTSTMARASATRARSRRMRPLRGTTGVITGRGICGPVGTKGARGRTVPVIDLATHVRQLRREVLQQSLQTNWRHSWQKRKLWTKDW